MYAVNVTCTDNINPSFSLFNYTVLDTTPPEFEDVKNGSVSWQRWINFTANFTVMDGYSLDWVWVESNHTGEFANYTFTELVGEAEGFVIGTTSLQIKSYRQNNSFNISIPHLSQVSWRGFANDTSGNIAETMLVNFTVNNTQPAQAEPSIYSDESPQAGGTNGNLTHEDLVCQENNVYDRDDEAVIVYYKWFENQTLITKQFPGAAETNTSILSEFYTKKYSYYSCEAVPDDSFDRGIARNTTELKIINAEPWINSIYLTPASVFEIHDITGHFSVEDRDIGDNLTAETNWLLNAEVQEDLQVVQAIDSNVEYTDILDSGRTTRDDIWTFEVNATDSYDPTPKSSESIVIQTPLLCQPDCTKGDGTCHAECDASNPDGSLGCSFHSDLTKDFCNLKGAGQTYIYSQETGHEIICCEGAPTLPLESEGTGIGIETDSSRDIIRTERTVVYNGKPIKIVIITLR